MPNYRSPSKTQFPEEFTAWDVKNKKEEEI